MTASFPSSVKSFSTKSDNVDDVMAVDINGIQDEVVAIETHLVTNYGVFKPLTTPLTSTSWNGDAYSTASKTLIDLSSVFGAPAGIKAVLLKVILRDSASSVADCAIYLSPNNTSGSGMVASCERITDDVTVHRSFVVPCDSNGDIYYQTVASGSGTLHVWLEIHGYWV